MVEIPRGTPGIYHAGEMPSGRGGGGSAHTRTGATADRRLVNTGRDARQLTYRYAGGMKAGDHSLLSLGKSC